MKTAIIGTGRVDKALLITFHQSYPDKILRSSRSKQKAQEVIQALGLQLKAILTEEALKQIAEMNN